MITLLVGICAFIIGGASIVAIALAWLFAEDPRTKSGKERGIK